MRNRKDFGLDKMMKKLRPGDTVVVWKLDRLGRSLIHLVDLLRYFRENNIEFSLLQRDKN